MRMFKIGLGIGHFAVVAPPTEVKLGLILALLLLLLLEVLVVSNTWRRLRFNASADGQDRANKMRRTARLEALLRYRVKEDTDCERLASAGAMQKSISFTFPRGVALFCSMSALVVDDDEDDEDEWMVVVVVVVAVVALGCND